MPPEHTEYQLPAQLGGATLRRATEDDAVKAAADALREYGVPMTALVAPNVGVILVPTSALTPVMAEPPSGSVVRARGRANGLLVWFRWDFDQTPGGQWWRTGGNRSVTWPEVTEAAGPDGLELLTPATDTADGDASDYNVGGNMMGELVAWLREVLDEDEAFARAAVTGEWRWANPDYPRVYVAGNGNRTIAWCANGYDNDLSNARHIARHDPAAVLADIAAKRALLDALEEPTTASNVAGKEGLVSAVQIIAGAYAHRPGYPDRRATTHVTV